LLTKSFLNNFEEIHSETMAIITQYDEKDKVVKSLNQYESRDTLVPHTPTKLVDLECKCYGSYLKGRIEGTTMLCGITHKPPIIIDSPQGIYFLPTMSPLKPECTWLSHSHIERVIETKFGQADIHFINGRNFLADVSFHSIQNQLMRASQFRFIVENRKIFARRRDQAKQFINPFAKTLNKKTITNHLLPFE